MEEAALASSRRRPPPLEPPPTVESPLVLTELPEVGLVAGGVVVDGGATTRTAGGAGVVASVAAVVAATAFFLGSATALASMLQHLSERWGNCGGTQQLRPAGSYKGEENDARQHAYAVPALRQPPLCPVGSAACNLVLS